MDVYKKQTVLASTDIQPRRQYIHGGECKVTVANLKNSL